MNAELSVALGNLRQFIRDNPDTSLGVTNAEYLSECANCIINIADWDLLPEGGDYWDTIYSTLATLARVQTPPTNNMLRPRLIDMTSVTLSNGVNLVPDYANRAVALLDKGLSWRRAPGGGALWASVHGKLIKYASKGDGDEI